MTDELTPAVASPEAAPSAPAAPAPSAPAPATSPASAPASAGAPSPSTTGTDATQAELAAFKALGYTPEQIRQITAEHRQFSEATRAYQEQQRAEYLRSEAGQREAQRLQAFLELQRQARQYDPEHAADREALDALRAERDTARVRDARDTFATELRNAGVDVANSEHVTELENLASGLIQTDDRLNAMYFDPQSRAEAVRLATQAVVGVLNRQLIAAGAADLRTLSARRTAVPRTARGGSLAATVADFTPKAAPGSPAYRREWREAGSRALDAVFDSIAS